MPKAEALDSNVHYAGTGLQPIPERLVWKLEPLNQ